MKRLNTSGFEGAAPMSENQDTPNPPARHPGRVDDATDASVVKDSLTTQVEPPPGYVIVPLIPTEAMSEAGHEVISRVYITSDDCPSADDAYAAMLAARDATCKISLQDGVADLLAALTKIASFDDVIGNHALDTRGSYARFDDPTSVRTAREAIAAWNRRAGEA